MRDIDGQVAGVFLDWVTAHFQDSLGLARFDGTPLYEHEAPRLGEHKDWGTYILNFGRNEGAWILNKYGGRENLEAIEFLKQFNHLVHERFPGAVTMAEESTSFPMLPRNDYRLGVPQAGFYKEILNADAQMYDDSNMGNGGGVFSEDVAWMGQPHSARITVPPLSCPVLRRDD